MKKKIFILLMVLIFISISQVSFAEKKEYRIGLKGGVINPSSNNGTTIKNDAMVLTLELDIKRSSRLDTGFRVGWDAFAVKASNYNACYDLLLFGYGARYYFGDRQSPETVFHTLKSYVMADAVMSLGFKYRDLDGTANSPQNLIGAGGKVGAGFEYVFGPLSSGFVDLEYGMINSYAGSGNYEFPMRGFEVAFGVRLVK